MSTLSVVREAPLRRRLWTVEEFQAAIRAGVFHEDERLELIEGAIVEHMPRDPHHSSAVTLCLLVLNRVLGNQNCYIRTENPVTFVGSQPQPARSPARSAPNAAKWYLDTDTRDPRDRHRHPPLPLRNATILVADLLP